MASKTSNGRVKTMKRPKEVTPTEWETYKRVSKIVTSYGGKMSGKPTRTDPNYYSKISKLGWEKRRQAKGKHSTPKSAKE